MKPCRGQGWGQFISVSLVPSMGPDTQKNSRNTGKRVWPRVSLAAVINTCMGVRAQLTFCVIWLLYMFATLAQGPEARRRSQGALCHCSWLQRSHLPWNSKCILSRARSNMTRVSAQVSGLSSLTEVSVLWCWVQCQLCSVLTKPEITLWPKAPGISHLCS